MIMMGRPMFCKKTVRMRINCFVKEFMNIVFRETINTSLVSRIKKDVIFLELEKYTCNT